MIMNEPKETKNYYRELVEELAEKGIVPAMLDICHSFAVLT